MFSLPVPDIILTYIQTGPNSDMIHINIYMVKMGLEG